MSLKAPLLFWRGRGFKITPDEKYIIIFVLALLVKSNKNKKSYQVEAALFVYTMLIKISKVPNIKYKNTGCKEF